MSAGEPRSFNYCRLAHKEKKVHEGLFVQREAANLYTGPAKAKVWIKHLSYGKTRYTISI